MLEISATDLAELSTFPLRWRWTDARYAVLSDDELARIRPLPQERAQAVCSLALTSLSTASGDFNIDAALRIRRSD